MNCHDARERLSDWLDDALSGPDRAELESHLEGCPDCRRELDGLRATVSLLSRVERPRAPVGFVDRVMAAAHPVPWYRRLGRRLFRPLSIKLPAQAAAVLVIALLGVYLLQRTPELRDAARPELRTPAPSSEAPAAKPDARPAELAPSPAPGRKAAKTGQADSEKLSERAPGARREAENIARDARRLDSPQLAPPAAEEPKQEPRKEADTDYLQKGAAPTSRSAPVPQATTAVPPASGAAPAESRAKSRKTLEEESKIAPAAPPAMSDKRQSSISGALGRLNVTDRPAAEKALADLLVRLGGSEAARRQEPGATVIDVVVPEARYADFVRDVATLGGWTLEGQPTALPTEPGEVRLSIRISE
jgi:putative zinc finger protein